MKFGPDVSVEREPARDGAAKSAPADICEYFFGGWLGIDPERAKKAAKRLAWAFESAESVKVRIAEESGRATVEVKMQPGTTTYYSQFAALKGLAWSVCYWDGGLTVDVWGRNDAPYRLRQALIGAAASASRWTGDRCPPYRRWVERRLGGGGRKTAEKPEAGT